MFRGRPAFDEIEVQHERLVWQENAYYPFGLAIKPLEREGMPDHRFTYNGKELEETTDLLEFEARMHDPQTGRFHGIDPKAETYATWSPYVYAGNDPVRFVEVRGEWPNPFSLFLGEVQNIVDAVDQKVTHTRRAISEGLDHLGEKAVLAIRKADEIVPEEGNGDEQPSGISIDVEGAPTSGTKTTATEGHDQGGAPSFLVPPGIPEMGQVFGFEAAEPDTGGSEPSGEEEKSVVVENSSQWYGQDVSKGDTLVLEQRKDGNDNVKEVRKYQPKDKNRDDKQ